MPTTLNNLGGLTKRHYSGMMKEMPNFKMPRRKVKRMMAEKNEKKSAGLGRMLKHRKKKMDASERDRSASGLTA